MTPVLLVGPTGVGKTALALRLAEQLPLEIVSIDSALIYRGMDIGTAKPTLAERAAVPHHLIDLLDPRQSYSAAAFVRDALQAVADIRSRGRLPLLVGGTMLYVKALREGLSELPASTPMLRAQIDAEAQAHGWPAVHAELAKVDPYTAARLHTTDAQRIQRALEVFRASGRPLSDWHAKAPRAAGVDWPLISIETEDRAWLHQRLDERFDAMLEAGLLDEVIALRERGDLRPEMPSMRCVGYRQTWEALDAADPPDLAHLRERGKAATRQLAKRQITWLRSMPHRLRLDAKAPDLLAQLATAVRRSSLPG